MSTRPRRNEFLAWAPDSNMTTVAAKIAYEYKKMGGEGGVVEKANHESIRWMERVAAKNLNDSIKAHGRVGYTRSGKLERVIKDDKSHTWNNKGWRFMVAEKVEPQIVYAFSLEYGYAGNVGEYRWFLFLGRKNRKDGRADLEINRKDRQEEHRTARKRDVTRSTHPTKGVRSGGDHSLFADRIVGRSEQTGIRKDRATGKPVQVSKPLKARYFNREGDYIRVKIQRPIPAYRYGGKAGDQFDTDEIYVKMLEKVKADFVKLKNATNTDVLIGTDAASLPKPGKKSRKTRPKTGRKSNAGKGYDPKYYPIQTRQITDGQ